MRQFSFTTLGAAVATLCVGMMTTVTSLHGGHCCKRPGAGTFTASEPVQINPTTDYLYPIRAEYYNSLYQSNVNGNSGFITADFSPDNTVWFNTWFAGPLRVNPTNPKNIVVSIGHDVTGFTDPNYFPAAIDIVIAYSMNGGKTWNTSVVPISTWETPSGNLAQTSAFADLRFDSSGNLYVLGTAIQTVTNTAQENILYWTSYLTQFSDTNLEFGNGQYSPVIDPISPTPINFADAGLPAVNVNTNTGAQDPNTLIPDTPTGTPAGIVFVVKSTNGGRSWGTPSIVDAAQTPAYIFTDQGLSTTPVSLFVGSGGNLVVNSTRVENLNTLFSYLYAATSSDGGTTWSTQSSATSINASTPVYTLFGDATFQAQVSVDPFYFDSFPNAGQPYAGNMVQTSSGLLMPMLREYPLPLTLQFDDTVNTTLADRVVILSSDGGTTWGSSATVVTPFTFSSNHNPHLTDPELLKTGLIIIDGSLDTVAAVSPKTGRVYVMGQGGNGVINDSPSINQFYPAIQLSVSSDGGGTWSVPFNANQTPIDFNNLGAAQAFDPSIAITQDGYVGVLYYDYRFFQPTDPADLINTDAWLAIYQELPDPTDGPAGNGLQLVKEVRLTPTSFNAANAISFPLIKLPGLFEYDLGTSTGLDVVGNDFYAAITQAGGTPTNSLISNNPNYGGLVEDRNNHSNAWFVKVTGPR